MTPDADKNLRTVSVRLEFLLHHAPQCLQCGSRQVQLIEYLNPPAQWRCRGCKRWFAKEPEVK